MFDLSEFNPEEVKKEDMIHLADAIENYIDLFREVMIIPKEISKREEREVQMALNVSAQLIKKLRKGDTSVFKEVD